MKTPRLPIYLLGSGVLLALGYALYTRGQEALWKSEVRGLSQRLAYLEAKADFAAGRRRLLRLHGHNSELRFSGEREGDFEIWIPEYYPSLSTADDYGIQTHAELYNTFMKAMDQESRRPKGAVVKVAVLADGRLTVDGKASGIEDLKQSMRHLSDRRGEVWYYREASQKEAPPIAMEVMKLVANEGVAIRLSSRPDYSDSIGPGGKQTTR